MIRDPKFSVGLVCGLFVGLLVASIFVRGPIANPIQGIAAAMILAICGIVGAWAQFVVMSRRL